MITVSYTQTGGGNASQSDTYTMDKQSNGKGWGGVYYMTIPDLQNVTSADVSFIVFGSINTTWKAPYINIQCTKIENSI